MTGSCLREMHRARDGRNSRALRQPRAQEPGKGGANPRRAGLQNRIAAGLAVLALAPACASFAQVKNAAIDRIDFGTNIGPAAGDGFCSDPRFEDDLRGARKGMADDAHPEDMYMDARDCFEAFRDGAIRLRDRIDGIDFGADAEPRDYACDDPRFAPLIEVDPRPQVSDRARERNDASDCRSAYVSGKFGLYDERHQLAFGSNTGPWPEDGECDDPRFRNAPGASRRGMAEGQPDRWSLGGDAADCRAAMEAGLVEPRLGGSVDGFVFGDNSSSWSFDFACDDPRLENAEDFSPDRGPVMADVLIGLDVGRDASDCREAYELGNVRLTEISDLDGISFGDDTGRFAYDGECDDPRFENLRDAATVGMAESLVDENWARDATDCYRAFRDGLIRIRERAE